MTVDLYMRTIGGCKYGIAYFEYHHKSKFDMFCRYRATNEPYKPGDPLLGPRKLRCEEVWFVRNPDMHAIHVHTIAPNTYGAIAPKQKKHRK